MNLEFEIRNSKFANRTGRSSHLRVSRKPPSCGTRLGEDSSRTRPAAQSKSRDSASF